MNPFHTARWVGLPGEAARRIDRLHTAYYRLCFDAPAGASLPVHISAHSRYRLWVNGQPVTFGPCRGDRWRHFYETVDVGPYLAAGANTLAVKVLSFPPYEAQHGDQRAPYNAMARATGPCLIVSAHLGGEDLSTGVAPWMALEDEAVSWKHFPLSHWMGAMESVDGAKLPHGWQTAADSAPWQMPQLLWKAEDPWLDTFGIIPTFPLTPRSIPLLFERPQALAREMPLRAQDVPAIRFEGGTAVIPPHSRVAAELDAGVHTTAFVTLHTQGGAGSVVTLRYAEGYTRPTAEGRTSKGLRDDWQNYELLGHEDRYAPGGGSESYTPMWFRTFRFVRVEVQTGQQPLTLRIPTLLQTGYPLEPVTWVRSSQAWVQNLWDMSVRTLQNCMHETYEDCPYYEQLQYIQDTRLEMLFTYMVSGDTRLARKAIEDFQHSQLPDGMLQARFPTQEPHVIPPFSLHWVWMVLEYYEQTGDPTVLRQYRAAADAILEWYDRKLGPLGLVEKLGYWDQIDWVDAWDKIAGRTPAGAVGPATTHNLMYACALQAGARINRACGRQGLAEEYLERAQSILSCVDAHCWNEAEGLYTEGPGYEEYSQHAQVYAVLTGLAPGRKGRDILTRALNRPGIALCSFTWQFFVFRALEACGAYELTERQWEMWKGLPDKNLTTIPEVPDGVRSPRSDCHAWGALPLYEFPRKLLGVEPGEPGWHSIRIRPRPLTLPDCSGQVVTPRGIVTVAWRNGPEGFAVEAQSPQGVPLTVTMPDGTERHYPQGGDIRVVTKG